MKDNYCYELLNVEKLEIESWTRNHEVRIECEIQYPMLDFFLFTGTVINAKDFTI